MTDVQEITNLSEFVEAIESSRAVVDFARRNGCAPCRALEPHFKAAANSPVLEDINFYKVMLDEVDMDFLDYIIEKVGILSTPTVLEYRFGGVYDDIQSRTAIALVKELSSG